MLKRIDTVCMKRIVEESKKKRVLIVVTNHETLGKTSYPAGLWLSELTHPYFELADHGIEVDIASPKGDKAPIDPYSDPRNPNITEIANTEKNLPLTVVQLDVNDDRSVKDAISKIVAEKGRIDILVNNAGYGLFSPIEDVTIDQVKEQFETNFFGVVRVTKEVLPIIRKQRKGTIVNVSSSVGRVGMPLSPAYAASKFALEGLSESIRYELKEWDINIVVVEPGVIKTNFVENSGSAHTTLKSESPYADLIGSTMK